MVRYSNDMSVELPPVPAARALAYLARGAERALDDAGMSMSQYRMMAYLSHQTDGASDLAGKLQISRPSVTALVDGLEAKGFVVREPDPTDRRRTAVVLTRKGRAALAKGDKAIEAYLGRIGEHLPDQRCDEPLAALSHWGLALRAARAKHLDQQRSGTSVSS